MSLWYEGHFELKATKTLLAQEKLLPSLNYLEELELGTLPLVLSEVTIGPTPDAWISAFILLQ